VNSNVTKSSGTYKRVVSVNLHRKCLEEYFLSTEDARDYGKLLAVVRPFDSPAFESRFRSDLDDDSLKNLFGNSFILHWVMSTWTYFFKRGESPKNNTLLGKIQTD
jgi:hypothetical protein